MCERKKMSNVTIAIIKPNVVREGRSHAVLRALRKAGLYTSICADNPIKFQWTRDQAERFYAEHKGKPFFDELVEFMSSGPCICMHLEIDGAKHDNDGDDEDNVDAVKAWRALIGPTDPVEAREKCPESLRALYGGNCPRLNGFHGSDSKKSAKAELKLLQCFIREYREEQSWEVEASTLRQMKRYLERKGAF